MNYRHSGRNAQCTDLLLQYNKCLEVLKAWNVEFRKLFPPFNILLFYKGYEYEACTAGVSLRFHGFYLTRLLLK